MLEWTPRRTIALIVALLIVPFILAMAEAQAAEDGNYPDLRGQWTGILRSRPGIPGQACNYKLASTRSRYEATASLSHVQDGSDRSPAMPRRASS